MATTKIPGNVVKSGGNAAMHAASAPMKAVVANAHQVDLSDFLSARPQVAEYLGMHPELAEKLKTIPPEVVEYMKHPEQAAAAVASGVPDNHPAKMAQQLTKHLEVEARGASLALTDAQKSSHIDELLAKAQSYPGLAGLAGFIGLPLAGFAGGVVEKAGKGIGVMGIANAGASVRNTTKAIENATFETTLGKQTMRGAVQSFFDSVAKIAEPVVNATGLGRRRSARNFGKAQMHFDDAKKALTGLNLSDLHADVRPHVEVIANQIGGAASHAHLNMGEINAAVEGIDTVVAAAASSKAAINLPKSAQTFLGSTGKMVEHHTASIDWKNVGVAIKDTPNKLAKVKTVHGIANAAFIAGDAISMTMDARTFTKNLKTLKEMIADAKGIEPAQVSTFTALFSGDVPLTAKAARKNIIMKTGVKEVIDGANMLLNVKQATDPKMSMAKMFAWFGATTAAGIVADQVMGESVLPLYSALRLAEKTGQPIPPEAMAQFIGEINSDLKSRGGAESPFAQEVANQVIQEHLSLADIMKENETGKIMLRVHKVIEENEKPKIPSVAQAPVAQQAPAMEAPAVEAAPAKSHVERLSEPKPAHTHHHNKTPKEVVGTHTAKVAAGAGDQNLQTGQALA
ncbi:MAG: hypothetical protein SFT92_02245 [Rickettsiales bacterium]|nr:hypothetical protein [Rickettsiales bacterium]